MSISLSEVTKEQNYLTLTGGDSNHEKKLFSSHVGDVRPERHG